MEQGIDQRRMEVEWWMTGVVEWEGWPAVCGGGVTETEEKMERSDEQVVEDRTEP